MASEGNTGAFLTSWCQGGPLERLQSRVRWGRGVRKRAKERVRKGAVGGGAEEEGVGVGRLREREREMGEREEWKQETGVKMWHRWGRLVLKGGGVWLVGVRPVSVGSGTWTCSQVATKVAGVT